MTVADACEAYIAQAQHLRASSIVQYVQRLGPFAERFGHRRLDSIQPSEVIQWITSYRGKREGGDIGPSTRAILFRYVKQLHGWARDTGIIELDPFARVPSPWRVQSRSSPMTADEYERFMTLPRVSKQLKEVVEFIWRTGIRPGEVAILSARHMDARLPIARFQPTEHKTGTKTGLQREVYFPADLWDRLKNYADRRPREPLLRRPNGKPWTSKIITDLYCDLKKKHGLKAVLYQARHRWATDMLDAGVPQARVAKMMGHAGTGTLMTNYYHPEAQTMAAEVEMVAGKDAEAERLKRIEETIARREDERRERKRALNAARQRKYKAKKASARQPDLSDT
jgi:integrase